MGSTAVNCNAVKYRNLRKLSVNITFKMDEDFIQMIQQGYGYKDKPLCVQTYFICTVTTSELPY